MNISFGPDGTPAIDDARELMAKGIEQAPFAVLLFLADERLTLIWRNTAHAVMSTSEDADILGKGMFEAFPPSADEAGAAAMEAIVDAVARIKATHRDVEIGPYRYDLKNAAGDYVEHHWLIKMSPVVSGGHVAAVVQTATDVTDQVLNSRLAKTLQRAASVTAAVTFFKYDPVGDYFERSEDVDRIFGFEPGEAGPTAVPFFERVHPEDLPLVQQEVARIFAAPRGELAFFDYRVNLPDGAERFVRIRAEVSTDPIDRREKLVGSFIDLTDVENDRRALKREISNREALVKEANHRIKNSLAIALSILRMEKRAIAEQEADSQIVTSALENLESRIRSISNAHGLMTLDGNNLDVSLQSMVRQLVEQLRATADLTVDEIRLSISGPDVYLASAKATSVSLIINEMMTNAMKYGLNSDGAADISIDMKVAEEQVSIAMVNRIERDSPIEAITSTKIGSMLTSQIAADLDATLTSENKGTTYQATLSFPIKELEQPT